MPTNVYPGGGARGQAQAVAGWYELGVQAVMLSRWQPHNRLSGFRPESCWALHGGAGETYRGSQPPISSFA